MATIPELQAIQNQPPAPPENNPVPSLTFDLIRRVQEVITPRLPPRLPPRTTINKQ